MYPTPLLWYLMLLLCSLSQMFLTILLWSLGHMYLTPLLWSLCQAVSLSVTTQDVLQLQDPEWKPDFGPAEFIPSWGATAVGARKFLIAYNINVLGTKEQAHHIALSIREQGPPKVRQGSGLPLLVVTVSFVYYCY